MNKHKKKRIYFQEKYKIIIITTLLAISCLLTYYFHVTLNVGTFFTHFFYIPIILAALWWKRKGLIVAIFLAALLIFSHTFLRYNVMTINDYLRAVMFIVVSLVIAMLSEQTTKAKEKLQETQDYLENLFNYANAPIIVWDPLSKITRFNQAFEQLAGRSANEVIGKKLDILFPEDRKKKTMEHVRQALTGERWETVEIPILHVDGTVRTVLWNSASIYDADGKTIIAIIAQGTDITDRKRAEDALRSAEKDWHNSFNSLEDVMLIIDRDFNIEQANDSALKLLGKTRDEIVGRKCYQIIHGRENQGEFCPVSRVIKTKKVESVDRYEELFNKHFSIKCSPIFDENGDIVKFVDLMCDITDRKRAEKQIKTSLKEKNVLLKEIHHRVKNNLQIVTTLLELQSDYIKDEKAFERFNEIQNRVHAMALIHEKLYQSKNLSEIDFKEYTQDLLDDLFRTYGVVSEVVIPIINIDDIFLNVNTAIPCALIINELVSNSLKHAFPDGRKGEINIDLHLDTDNKFKLIVSDNGVGLQDDIDFRNTKSLGLQLVNNLVNQLEGSIEYYGKGGATFEITFTELK